MVRARDRDAADALLTRGSASAAGAYVAEPELYSPGAARELPSRCATPARTTDASSSARVS